LGTFYVLYFWEIWHFTAANTLDEQIHMNFPRT